MPDPKAHQLYKQLPGCTAQYKSEGTVITGAGWEVISESANILVVAARGYIDLQGWSAQDLTTFTQGVDIQKQHTPQRSLTATGMVTADSYDFITTRRLTDAEIDLDPSLGGAENNLPGFGESTVDLMQVIYGERMQYAVNAGTGPGTGIAFSYVQISGETFGSGNPTAMSRMHWTRVFYIFAPVNQDAMAIFPANLVVQAMTIEEKDVIWFERLRRSHMHHDRAGI